MGRGEGERGGGPSEAMACQNKKMKNGATTTVPQPSGQPLQLFAKGLQPRLLLSSQVFAKGLQPHLLLSGQLSAKGLQPRLLLSGQLFAKHVPKRGVGADRGYGTPWANNSPELVAVGEENRIRTPAQSASKHYSPL